MLVVPGAATYSVLIMVRYALMAVTCIFVTGAMAFILTWFTRRLQRIEEDRWGAKKDWASGTQTTRAQKKTDATKVQ